MKIPFGILLLLVNMFMNALIADETIELYTSRARTGVDIRAGSQNVEALTFQVVAHTSQPVKFYGFVATVGSDNWNLNIGMKTSLFMKSGTNLLPVGSFRFIMSGRDLSGIIFNEPIELTPGTLEEFHLIIGAPPGVEGNLRLGLSRARIFLDEDLDVPPIPRVGVNVLPGATGSSTPLNFKFVDESNRESTFHVYQPKWARATFPTESGQSYMLEYSYDLRGWFPSTPITGDGKPVGVDWEIPVPNVPSMFLRLKPVEEATDR